LHFLKENKARSGRSDPPEASAASKKVRQMKKGFASYWPQKEGVKSYIESKKAIFKIE